MPPLLLTPQDEELLDELFENAVACLATGKRIDLEGWLGGREHLRDSAESTLETARGVAVGTAPRLPHGKAPEVSGYRVLDELGRGSMGIVYRAEQQSLSRTVALKVLSPSLLISARARERFEAEARALARVRHPNVVMVHEVVLQPELCAYAMEWLIGRTLSQAIEADFASIAPRRVAELGLALARALEAVHGAGLVHRDVKPSNVMLCYDGRVVLTDFGLALHAELWHGTASGEFLGTAAYAAPEQLRGERENVGARSDIYALGVTLYVALSGQTPFGTATPSSILRRIEEGRAQPLAKLNPAVPRDLVTIIGKAMDAAPAQRYQTATDLAEDLERFLAQRPIRARRVSLALRTRRWAQRNPWMFATMLVLAAGAGISTWFAMDARAQTEEALDQKRLAEVHEAASLASAERNVKLAGEMSSLARAERVARTMAERNAAEARLRAEESEQVLRFHETQWADLDAEALGLSLRRALLDRASEEQRSGLELRLQSIDLTGLAAQWLEEQVFERAHRGVASGFPARPRVQARLLQGIALPLSVLGSKNRALELQTEALEIIRATPDGTHQRLFSALEQTAALLSATQRYPQAETLIREALELSYYGGASSHRDFLRAQLALGVILEKRGLEEQGEPMIRDTLELCRLHLGPEDPLTLSAVEALAEVCLLRSRWAEAILGFLLIWQRSREVHGGDSEECAAAEYDLAHALYLSGRVGEAEPLLRKALMSATRVRGEDHPQTLRTALGLATVLRTQGNEAEARSLRERALRSAQRALVPKHPIHARLRFETAVLDRLESDAEICSLGFEVLAEIEARSGSSSPESIEQRCLLAKALLNAGRHQEAEAIARAATIEARRILAVDDSRVLEPMECHGLALSRLDRDQEAERTFAAGYERSRTLLGADHSTSLRFQLRLAQSRLQARDRESALELAAEGLERAKRALGGDSSIAVEYRGLLANVHRERLALADAESWARESLAGELALRGEEHPATLLASASLADILRLRGNLREAEELLSKTCSAWERIGKAQLPNALDAQSLLAQVLLARGRVDAAAKLLKDVCVALESAQGAGHPRTLYARLNLAQALRTQGRFTEALAELAQMEPLVAEMRTLRGASHPLTISVQLEQGVTLLRMSNAKESLEKLREVFHAYVDLYGAEDRRTLDVENQVALALQGTGQLAEAERIMRRVHEAHRSNSGPEHPNTLVALNFLGSVLARQDRFDEAESVQRAFLERAERVFGPSHANTLSGLASLGALLDRRGQPAAALEVLQQAVDRGRSVGAERPATVSAIANCGVVLLRLKRFAEAEPLLREALLLREKLYGKKHAQTLAMRLWLGRLLHELQRMEELEELLSSLEREFATETQADGRAIHGELLFLKGSALWRRSTDPDYESAEAFLGEAFRQLRSLPGQRHDELSNVEAEMDALFKSWIERNPGIEVEVLQRDWERRKSSKDG